MYIKSLQRLNSVDVASLLHAEKRKIKMGNGENYVRQVCRNAKARNGYNEMECMTLCSIVIYLHLKVHIGLNFQHLLMWILNIVVWYEYILIIFKLLHK